MNVIDLDGNYHKWSLTGHIAKGSLNNKSQFHIKARLLIKKCFPTLQILEEVSIPLRKSETLYLDFYIPLIKTCIEVHGEQHFSYTPFYHGSRLGFIKHQKRDSDKKLWCMNNNIKLIELAYNEDESIWLEKINNE